MNNVISIFNNQPIESVPFNKDAARAVIADILAGAGKRTVLEHDVVRHVLDYIENNAGIKHALNDIDFCNLESVSDLPEGA